MNYTFIHGISLIMKALFFSHMNQLYSIRCRFNRVAIENILVGA